jgi:hypothetical protein
MSRDSMKLHEEDVITYEGEVDLFSYRLSMPATFRVQELKDEIARNFDKFDNESSKCRVLSHSDPGWKSGEINVRIEVIVEFKETDTDQVNKLDSFEELRSLNT